MKLAYVLMIAWLLSHTQLCPHRNLLDPDNFVYDAQVNMLQSIESIPVEGGATYVLSVPHTWDIENLHVLVKSVQGHSYVNENLYDLGVCKHEFHNVQCKITMSPNTVELEMVFSNGNLLQYLSFYGFKDFQFEKGSEGTDYTPYMPQREITFFGEQEIEVSYRLATPIETLVADHITVEDNVDGDITDRLIIAQDPYTGNERVTGDYVVILEVSDTSGNRSSMDFVIKVVDRTKPVIQGPNEINVQFNDQLSIETIVSNHFTFHDDYDGDISDFEVTSTDYTINQMGTFEATFQVSDTSLNVSERTFLIHVIQTQNPRLEGPPYVQLYLSENPTIDCVLALFSGFERGSNAPLAVQFEHSNKTINFSRDGSYVLTLLTEDGQSNTERITVHLRLLDDIPPVFKFDDKIVTPLGTTLAEIDLFYLLIDHYKAHDFIVEGMVVLEDEYTLNAHAVGTYPFKVSLTNQQGDELIHQGRIQVTEVLESETPWPTRAILWFSASFTLMLGAWIKFKK